MKAIRESMTLALAVCAWAIWGCNEPREAASVVATDGAEYQFVERASRIETRTPSMGYEATFDASGASLRRSAGGPALAVAYRGAGCDGASDRARSLSLPRVVPGGGRVVFPHRATVEGGVDLEEWFVNGEQGLEQGFTMSRLPDCAADRALVIQIAFGGGFRTVDGWSDERVNGPRDDVAIIDGSTGVVAYRYGKLFAFDATGRELGAELVAVGDGVDIVVDARGAEAPIVIDPTFWIDESTLFAPDGAASDAFGASVSLSADGGLAIVGARTSDVGGLADQGSAYVFARSGATWAPQQKLVASDGASGDRFGGAVAMSADGARVIVAADGADIGATANAGAAYVFVRSGSTWAEEQKLVPPGVAPGPAGTLSVAVSSDGSRALLGYGSLSSARVFARSGATWTEEQVLSGIGGFGDAVALSGDATRAAIGAPNESGGNGNQRGRVHVFTRTGATWLEEQSIGATDGKFKAFGRAVALTPDGALLAVGVPGADVSFYPSAGAVYMYARSGATWTQAQKLVASDGVTDDLFGGDVALSEDGNTLGVGALLEDQNPGAAYLFTRSGALWMEEQKLIPSDGSQPSDFFASSVSLSADGARLLVGFPGDDVGATNRGSAPVFTRLAAPLGATCATASECPTGHCVDGVCCDAACGDGAPTDCQACSVAAGATYDGVCHVLEAGEACRNSAGACDTPEACDGASADCPADGHLPAGMVCRVAAGACDVPEHCSGSSVACPPDVFAGASTTCGPPGDACDPADTCNGLSGDQTACSTIILPDGSACPGGACSSGVCVGAESTSSSSSATTASVAATTGPGSSTTTSGGAGESGGGGATSSETPSGETPSGCSCIVGDAGGAPPSMTRLFCVAVAIGGLWGVRRRRPSRGAQRGRAARSEEGSEPTG